MAENLVKSPRGRTRRNTIGTRNRLTVHNKDANFEYRIVNDTDDRIDSFVQNGWEVVPAKDVKIGDRRADSISATGSAAEISVGGGTKGIVLRIKKEWYDEDQRAKADNINALENSMKEDAQRDFYGKITTSRD